MQYVKSFYIENIVLSKLSLLSLGFIVFYYLSYDVSIIYDKSKWKSVKAIGRIDVKRIENNKEKNY